MASAAASVQFCFKVSRSVFSPENSLTALSAAVTEFEIEFAAVSALVTAASIFVLAVSAFVAAVLAASAAVLALAVA